MNIKIGVYVLAKYAKQTYSNECYDVRINAGMEVVCDILRRSGWDNISYCSAATAHRYDLVLYSVTSDCDWWDFVAERVTWERGDYMVCVGGQGVLNPRPFFGLVDYFVLGRGEDVMPVVAQAAADRAPCEHHSVVSASTFSIDRDYYIAQVDEVYPHDIRLQNGDTYHEDVIGCNHKCLFCGYTWHRKHAKQEEFNYSGLWNGGKDRERAMIDMHNGVEVDLVKLRTTAIDGLSERIRYAVNKKISRDMLREFLHRLASCEKPHQVKFYNIVGYPTETEADWQVFLDDIAAVDASMEYQDRQTSILLHSTPFRAMPATPLACEPMAYRNFRGKIARTLGRGKYKGNIFYQGNAMWAVESMATESLPTVIQSAIIWRGTEQDTDAIVRVATSRKYWAAGMAQRQATLESQFDVGKLFGRYDPAELPTINIKTYCKVEKMWGMDVFGNG